MMAFRSTSSSPLPSLEKVAVLDADSYVRERAARGSREKFDRVLSKVPDVEPEGDNRLSPKNAA